MNDLFTPDDISRIVRSIALARLGNPLLSGELLPPSVLPTQARKALCAAVASFFCLDDAGGRNLFRAADTADYEEWGLLAYTALTRNNPGKVTFHTSGSTGEPCPYTFTVAELEEEVQSLAPYFKGRLRIVSVMPVHHVFGFVFALLLPKHLGIPVLQKPPLPSADFFATLQEGDLLLAFPVLWKSILDVRPKVLPPDIHGVTSTAPCPPGVIEALLAADVSRRPVLGQMTEIYGATEFGAVGIRRDCRASYTLLPHWFRAPLPPAHIWGIKRAAGALMPLPDEVSWEDERRFTPLRRRDRAVQVGGINVFPLRIADRIRSHPKVGDCAVRLMRPEEGSRLKAFIVPAEGVTPGSEFARELRQWIAKCLEPAERPKSFTFGETLPYTASGKIGEWPISDKPSAH